MLKISFIENARQRRLIVEGKLIAPWAAELRRAYDVARTDLCGRQLVIEMKQITAIGQEGENVILQLINAGVKFRGQGVYTKRVLKQLIRCASSGLRKGKK